MEYFKYQQKAIDNLTDKTIRLINEGGFRRKIIFKAPTGSGKTVMACQALARIMDTLKNDPSNRFEDVAFIWFAPRKLHLQSYLKLKEAFQSDRLLQPVMFDELEQNEGIQPGEILFVNWESINKESNRLANNTESKVSIFEIARITRERFNRPIIAVIDEEHMFWTKSADKTAAVLDKINPSVEIRISATPKTTVFDELERVGLSDVIEAGMIKKEVVLNPEIDADIEDNRTLTEHLLKTALAKRQQIADVYNRLGTDINPLLLIQLPNDTNVTMTTEELAIAQHIEIYLDKICGISAANGKLAVWLANRKENLDKLEEPDNIAQVLLFKEAIALGWDCPRAAVLLIFRKLASNEFTIQTVGRILRMPEHHHYTDDKLNVGYVYTDIAREKIEIISTDADYLKKNVYISSRRENLNNVKLKSVYLTRPNDTRNYLGPDFRSILFNESENFFNIERPKSGLFNFADLISENEDNIVSDDNTINENRSKVKNTLRLDVSNVNIPLPKDVHFQNKVQTLDVAGQNIKFSRTAGEIDRVFINFIAKYVSGFENKNHPADKLASYLLETISEYFGIYDTDAKKLVLFHENRPVFDRLIKDAIARYIKHREQKKLAAQDRIFAYFEWEIPDERVYDEDTHLIPKGINNHALSPFFKLDNSYQPEDKFIEFLERNSDYIDWWYKNGDSGRQHFAVPYLLADGTKKPFYIDFIIRLKNGKIFLFDTKTAGSEPGIAHLKHNGFVKYAKEQQASGIDLQGGIIIEDGENWIWPKFEISNTSDHLGWSAFIPRLENS